MGATLTTPSGQPQPLQPGEFEGSAPSSIVSWQLKRLAPPSPLYVQVDDTLQVAAASSQTSEVVTISYRLLRAMDGVVIYGQFTVAPSNNRTLAVAQQPMAEGFLLSVSCKAKVAQSRGQTFVRLFLQPKALGAGQPGLMMMADYVTTAMAPGYPNGRSLSPVEGPGALVGYQFSAATAGTDFTITLPTNVRWRLQSLRVILDTDGVAGNRLAQLLVYQSGYRPLRVPSPAAVPASTLATFSWAAGISPQSDASPAYTLSLPQGLILGGSGASLLQSFTTGLDGGDQWLAQEISVEEWLDNV